MKACTQCRQTKPLAAFHKQRRGKFGVQNWCKDCRKVHDAGRDRGPAFSERYRADPAFQAQEKARTRQRRTGCSPEQYQELLVAQDHSCAICGEHESKFVRGLHADHCHVTKKVRGLLCVKCNGGIGLLSDSPERLQKALSYLQRF